MRGRKPQPTALKVLRGNPGRRRLPEEPQPVPIVDLQPPEWLDSEAQAEWRRQAPMLARLEVLTESDVSALEAYCKYWSMWKDATKYIQKWGMVLKAKDGEVPVISPYIKIADKAMMHCRAFLIEFGLTPSSRSKVRVPKKIDVAAVSKWAGLK